MQFEIERAANMIVPEKKEVVWVYPKVKESCFCGCGCTEMYPVLRDSIPMQYRARCPRTGRGGGGFACDCMGRIIE